MPSNRSWNCDDVFPRNKTAAVFTITDLEQNDEIAFPHEGGFGLSRLPLLSPLGRDTKTNSPEAKLLCELCDDVVRVQQGYPDSASILPFWEDVESISRVAG